MTQPDELSPAGQFAPLSDLQAKTQGDWEDEIYADLEGHFTVFEAAMSLLLSVVQAIIDNIYNAAVFGVSVPVQIVGNSVDVLLDVIGWLFGASSASSASAASIQAQLAATAAGGVYYVDSADYAVDDTMPANYTEFSAGAGDGSYGPNGAGRFVWDVVGTTTVDKFYRYDDLDLSSDNGEVHVVISTGLVNNGSGNDPLLYLGGRMAADGDTAVMAALSYAEIQFFYMIDGTVTLIDDPVAWSPAPGDHLIFRYGIGAEPRRYQLLRNAVVVSGADVTEAGTDSMLGATYRGAGFGGTVTYAGSTAFVPPEVDVLAMADQNY